MKVSKYGVCSDGIMSGPRNTKRLQAFSTKACSVFKKISAPVVRQQFGQRLHAKPFAWHM